MSARTVTRNLARSRTSQCGASRKRASARGPRRPATAAKRARWSAGDRASKTEPALVLITERIDLGGKIVFRARKIFSPKEDGVSSQEATNGLEAEMFAVAAALSQPRGRKRGHELNAELTTPPAKIHRKFKSPPEESTV